MTLLIELIVIMMAQGHIPPTALLLPLIYIPLVLVTAGRLLAAAGLGVFFRDLHNAVAPIGAVAVFPDADHLQHEALRRLSADGKAPLAASTHLSRSSKAHAGC